MIPLVYLNKANTVIERNGSSIGGINEQVDVASPFFPRESYGSFEQVLSNSMAACLRLDGDADAPPLYRFILPIGLQGNGSQVLSARIKGYKGRIRLLLPPAPLLLFQVL